VLSKGDIVSVEVTEVDAERGRIALKLVSKQENGSEITPEQIGTRYKEQHPNAGSGGRGGGEDRGGYREHRGDGERVGAGGGRPRHRRRGGSGGGGDRS
jgi:polyribonucleotide nucleotidyltransferase